MTASRDLLDLLLRHVPAATMDAAVRDRAITAMARRLGIAAGEEDIQAAADQFRAERELLTYEATRRWLSRHWLSAENWHKLLEARVEARRLLDSPAIAAQVQESFEARAAEYARALVARLVVEDEGLAHELFLLVREGAHDFEVLARRYSLEPVRAGPGMPYLARRWRFRYELPPAVAERAFGVPVSEPIRPWRSRARGICTELTRPRRRRSTTRHGWPFPCASLTPRLPRSSWPPRRSCARSSEPMRTRGSCCCPPPARSRAALKRRRHQPAGAI
jgi:hypothetical protein